MKVIGHLHVLSYILALGESIWYPLNGGGCVGPVIGLRAVEQRIRIFYMQGIEHLFLNCSAQTLVTILTELTWHKICVVI
jgi:hypothetical protein